jgi:RimJ/RimL family protein N-acetyltransferase
MDTFADERDFKLLEGDRYTFFVLGRILKGPCKLILSDHERLIICFSGEPFPVWIWTPDDAAKEELERAYAVAAENGLLDGEHRFNLKYKLAELFMANSSKSGKPLSIETNMFAYDCPELKEPSIKAEGHIYKCTEDDEEELLDLIEAFHNAVQVDIRDREAYREGAKRDSENGKTYFWKLDCGETVGCCKYVPNGDLASLSLVLTKEEFRRRHFAENLVYRVTKIAEDAGFHPMLYTDADYVASNACYEKLGYIRRGELCTISCKG